MKARTKGTRNHETLRQPRVNRGRALAISTRAACVVLAAGAALAGTDQGMAVVRSRLLRLARLQNVDPSDGRLLPLIEALDWHAGNLLWCQVKSGGPTRGAFPPVREHVRGPRGAEGDVLALRRVLKGLRILSAAYWCPGSRFKGSPRVVAAVDRAVVLLKSNVRLNMNGAWPGAEREIGETALLLLLRRAATPGSPSTAFLQDCVRALSQAQANDGRAHRIRRARFRFLAAVRVGDSRQASAASLAMARAARQVWTRGRAWTDGHGRLDIPAAFHVAHDLAAHHFLADGTRFDLPASVVLEAGHFLNTSAGWMLLNGCVDPLGVPYDPGLESLRRQGLRGLADPLLLASGYLWQRGVDVRDPAVLAAWRRCARGRPVERNRGVLPSERDFFALTCSPIFAPLDEEAAAAPAVTGVKYFPDAAYLSVRQKAYSARLKLPSSSPKGGMGPGARAAVYCGAMTYAPVGQGGTPCLWEAAFGQPDLAPHWPTCTVAHALGIPPFGCNPAAFAGCRNIGAVVQGQIALAGFTLAAASPRGRMRALKSWLFLPDSVVHVVTGASVEAFGKETRCWRPGPRDARSCWWAVDLGQPSYVSRIRIHFHAAGERLQGVPREIVIHISEAGSTTWRLVHQVNVPRPGEDAEASLLFIVARARGRYLRLRFPRGAYDGLVSIAEVEAFDVPPGAAAAPAGRLAPMDLATQAMGARAFASSESDAHHRAGNANDGTAEQQSIALDAPRTNLAFLPAGETVTVGLGGGEERVFAAPAAGETRLMRGARWLHSANVCLRFLAPADLTVNGLDHEWAALCIEHRQREALAVQFLPRADVEAVRKEVREPGVTLTRADHGRGSCRGVRTGRRWPGPRQSAGLSAVQAGRRHAARRDRARAGAGPLPRQRPRGTPRDL